MPTFMPPVTVFGQYGYGPYRPHPGLFPGRGLETESFKEEWEAIYQTIIKKLAGDLVEEVLKVASGSTGKIAGKVLGKGFDFLFEYNPVGEGEEDRIREELRQRSASEAVFRAALNQWPAVWEAFVQAVINFPRQDVAFADP